VRDRKLTVCVTGNFVYCWAAEIQAGLSGLTLEGEYVELWFVSAGLFLVWFVLSVFLHKSGMVHLLLMAAIAIFVVQFAAFRKARHHKSMAGR